VQASYGLGTKVRTFDIWQARIRKKADLPAEVTEVSKKLVDFVSAFASLPCELWRS
jgi:hypothetical protein